MCVCVCVLPYSIKIHKFVLFYLVDSYIPFFMVKFSQFICMQDVLHKIARSMQKKVRQKKMDAKQIHSIAHRDPVKMWQTKFHTNLLCVSCIPRLVAHGAV